MKTIWLLATVFLLVIGLTMAEVHAQPTAASEAQRFKQKVTNNPSGIDSSFFASFGRSATPDEVIQWKKSDVTVGDLIKHLHGVLKSALGADELHQTLVRSYTTSFGRGPTPEELASGTQEAKVKGYGFTELLAAQHGWLKTPEADAERKGLVFRNFFEAYGRLPTVSESNGYRDEIEKLGMNYSDLLAWNMDRMLLPASFIVAGEKHEALGNELHDMIKRAFLTAGKGQPTEAQYKDWTVKVKDQKLTFKQVTAILEKSK